MEIMEALRSILHGFYVTGEDSSRKILDLWLQGEAQIWTVNVRIIRSTLHHVVETWLREERISSQECDMDMESLIRVIGVSAQVVGPRISSIEFLLPGYHNMTVKEAADGAMKLGLCLRANAPMCLK